MRAVSAGSGDVLTSDVFITGGFDRCVKLWDTRLPGTAFSPPLRRSARGVCDDDSDSEPRFLPAEALREHPLRGQRQSDRCGGPGGWRPVGTLSRREG